MRRSRISFGYAGLITLGLLVNATALADPVEGFRPIFDGKTLTGWDGDPDHWRVEDGAITGQTTDEKKLKRNTFIIWRQGPLDDFELKLEYRIVGGNSGIQIRSFEKPEQWGRWSVGGYQADLDSTDKWSGTLYDERARAVLAMRGQKTVIGEDHKPKVVGQTGDRDKLQAVIKKEDWNDYHVIVRGYHFTQIINGHVMSDVIDEDQEVRRRSGILALQLHAGPNMTVQFRNVRLKRVPMVDKKKIVLVAGKRSHGYGAHEHYAGCKLLADALNKHVPEIHAAVYKGGWPSDPTAFDNADAVVFYCDGGKGHVVNPHLDEFDKVMNRGVALACLHYAVETPKGRPGDKFLDWIGGYFETYWSVNPHWKADFRELPDHPIARGVKGFSIDDEWYYHMRFREEMKNVAPILTAIPPAGTLNRPDGPHSNNEHVRARKGMPEHVAWAYERPDGGRGFGFTGGHWHWNWGHRDFRTAVLNALVWIAGVEVPSTGVPSDPLTVEDLEANQDFKPPKNYNRQAIQKQLDAWNAGAKAGT